MEVLPLPERFKRYLMIFFCENMGYENPKNMFKKFIDFYTEKVAIKDLTLIKSSRISIQFEIKNNCNNIKQDLPCVKRYYRKKLSIIFLFLFQHLY